MNGRELPITKEFTCHMCVNNLLTRSLNTATLLLKCTDKPLFEESSERCDILF